MLAPGYPRKDEAPPDAVFVVMPAARVPRIGADGQGAISRHSPFVYVPRPNFLRELPSTDPNVPPEILRTPDFSVNDRHLGECDVFLFDRASVVFDSSAEPPFRYHLTGAVIGERPKKDEDKSDVRWISDMREIVTGATLDADCDPRVSTPVDTERVAAVVQLSRGVLSANFPCEQTGLQRIVLPDGGEIRRTFASEFIVTMQYPDGTDPVRLQINRITGNPQDDLMITWGASDLVRIRMGNDTLDEIVRLPKDDCTPMNTLPTDHDFELHYAISTNVPPESRPLPTVATGGEIRHNGCLSSQTS